jgi:hypothetical protein
MKSGVRFVFRPIVVLAWLFAVVLAASPVARAQDEPLPDAPPPVGEEAPGPPPPGLVTAEPYASWSRHAGTIEEAVALITVRDGDGKVQTGTGFAIRCDGFFLIPEWMRALLKDRATAVVTVAAVERENPTAPYPVASRTYHNNPRVRYSILKVTGHHVPCVPLLDAGSVAPGDKVRIVRAVPDQPGRCKAVSVLATVGRYAPEQEIGRKDRWTLTAREGQPPLKAEDTPAGAAVVDEATGAVLGMVLADDSGGTRAEPLFCSFLYFYDICGDVGLMPDRAAIEERKKQKTSFTAADRGTFRLMKPSGGLAWVPGGAVQLVGPLSVFYQRAYGTDIACMPGFFACVNPVTNQEYREWLLRQPVPRHPFGWDNPDELKYPRRNPTFPAVGMRPEEALAYARSRGWRLLTGPEWQRAAICEDGLWAEERVVLWQKMSIELFLLVVGRHEAWRERENLTRIEMRAKGRNPDNYVFNFLDSPEDQAFQSQLALLATNTQNKLGNELPWNPVTLDVRPEDVSMFGVRHVLMNSPEFVLPAPGQPERGEKRHPARIEPYISVIAITNTTNNRAQVARGRARDSLVLSYDMAQRYAVSDAGLQRGGTSLYLIVLLATRSTQGSVSWYGLPPMTPEAGNNQSVMPSGEVAWNATTLAGIRGAR